MAVEAAVMNSVMEGKGAYNRHAKIPASGVATAIPLLEKALEKIPLKFEGEPIVIADYGSSQGKNSLLPIATALGKIRSRVARDRPMFVYHVDQPSNDFNSLFGVLSTDSASYARAEPNLYPCAIGRSFYEQVLPPASVHFAWSSYAAVWLSRTPSLIPGHFIALCSTGAVRSAFELQAAADWKAFLALRSKEMRLGARLVVVLPGAHENSRIRELMERANHALAQMVEEGVITADERARMVIGSYPRRADELLAPFSNNSSFQDLVLEDWQELPLTDPAWTDYQLDRDPQALAHKQALFFRAVFMPSLAGALNGCKDGNAEAFNSFADHVQSRLIRRLAEDPIAADTTVQTLVVAKRG